MGWLDPSVTVPRVTMRRLEMLVDEVTYLDTEVELQSWERHEQVQQLVTQILDEYVRQHFEESTRMVARLMTTRRANALR